MKDKNDATPPAAPGAVVKELPLSQKQAEYIQGKYMQVQTLLDEINAVARFALFEHGTPPGNWQIASCRTKLVLGPDQPTQPQTEGGKNGR